MKQITRLATGSPGDFNCVGMEDESTAPMIGALELPSILLSEYENADSPGFIPGIKCVGNVYKHMRRIRGDGNCFYRAFIFSYLEGLLADYKCGEEKRITAEIERERITEIIFNSKQELVLRHSYSEIAIESFQEMLLELLENLFTHTAESLLALFQEDGSSDYFTWYIRLLTAGKMRFEEERFTPFIDDSAFTSMEAYCKREVEPMGKECEQVQIIALTEYMGVGVRIDYLDGRAFDPSEGLSHIECPGSATTSDTAETSTVTKGRLITLLYRPGHYDILYEK